MRIYENAYEIAEDLKVLRLRRDIAIEELKLVKADFKESFTLNNWLTSVFKFVGKLGMFKVVKKIL